LIRDRHQIELVAEVGVMLLLFTVGIKLRREGYGLLRGDADHGHPTLGALCRLPGVNRVPVPPGSAATINRVAPANIQKALMCSPLAVYGLCG